jgi:hypothetical protein
MNPTFLHEEPPQWRDLRRPEDDPRSVFERNRGRWQDAPRRTPRPLQRAVTGNLDAIRAAEEKLARERNRGLGAPKLSITDAKRLELRRMRSALNMQRLRHPERTAEIRERLARIKAELRRA